MAVKTATEKSVKELDDKLSTYAQDIDAKLSESRQNYDRLFAFTRGLDKKLTRNIQKHDALEKKVLDSLDVIKKENQLVDSKFSTLETRLNEIEKSTASSRVTHMKQHAQYTNAVATTTTFLSNRLCVRLWVLLHQVIKLLHIYRLLHLLVIHIRMPQV